MRFLFPLLLCLFSYSAFSQNNNISISEPLPLPKEGWSKLLLMRNGNTVLLHIEPAKAVVVTIFDSTHKQIATQKLFGKVLDVSALATAEFKGLYDINGEVVLFLDMDVLGRRGLVRARINGRTAVMIEDKVVGQTNGVMKPTEYYVMKEKASDIYYIFSYKDMVFYPDLTMDLAVYNGHHELLKTIPLPLKVARKAFDHVFFLSAQLLSNNGVCISLHLSKMNTNETVGGVVNTPGQQAVYDNSLAVFYLPKGNDTFKTKIADLSQYAYPFYTNATYNSISQSIDLLLFNFRDMIIKNGLELRPVADFFHVFVMMDEETLATSSVMLENKMADTFLQQKTGSDKAFAGFPLKTVTNDYGVTTTVFEQLDRFETRENWKYTGYNTRLGNICVTQVNQNGKELWGEVLPASQILNSRNRYLGPINFGYPSGEKHLFIDMPPEFYQDQFASLNFYTANKNSFLVYNDIAGNINNSLEKPGDTVYDFNFANTVYNKIDRKGVVTKSFLWGQPSANESNSTLIESADFDDKTHVYAALIQCRKGKDITTHVAWSHLD